MTKYITFLVRGTTKTHHDIPTLDKARTVAKDEAEIYPGRPVEIYQLVEVAEVSVNPVEYKSVVI